MSTEQPEEPQVHDGPDPRDWHRKALLWMAVEDVRAADEMLELLLGSRALPHMTASYQEAVSFLSALAAQVRESLAAELLAAYKIPVPEEPAELPTEAVGGQRGDSDGPGDRDHVRPVRG